MEFNEILPRSPHWLHGESMVADFQHKISAAGDQPYGPFGIEPFHHGHATGFEGT
jgi:hypothetical protein